MSLRAKRAGFHSPNWTLFPSNPVASTNRRHLPSSLPTTATDTRPRDALYALPCKRFIAGIALYTVAQVMGRRAPVPPEDSSR